jgi:hypothetical protein
VNTATVQIPVGPWESVFEDAFGKRYISAGPGGEHLEILALRDELTAVSSFEAALRGRVGELAGFQSPSFARIRGVLPLGTRTPALAVVAEPVGGTRLSHILATAEEQLLPIEIGVALDMIRQLVRAVAALHKKMPGIAHGAITPERIAITSQAELIVLDSAFGAALETLRYSRERYWKDLSIPLPLAANGPRFDQRSDIMQVGAVALALLIGRPLYTEEFPDKIGALANCVWGITPTGGVQPLPSALRTWLARALQLDAAHAFGSAVEAWPELDHLLGGAAYLSPLGAMQSFLAEYRKHSRSSATETLEPTFGVSAGASASPKSAPGEGSTSTNREPEPTATEGTPATLSKVAASNVALSNEPVADALLSAAVAATPTRPTQPGTAPTSPTDPPAAPHTGARALPFGIAAGIVRLSEQFTVDEKVNDNMRNGTPWWRRPRIAVAAVVAVLTCGGALAGRSYLTAPAAAEPPGTLVVETNPPDVPVMIDGQLRGSTPLTLTLTSGSHTLELLAAGTPRRIPLTISAGSTVSHVIELPKAETTTGKLQIHSDQSGARVTVDGTSYGTAPLTIDGLTPGPHTVVIVHRLGSVTQEVVVEAGATASLVVPMAAPEGAPVSGWITVAAPTEVHVYEDTRLLGSSRSDRIMVSVGRHEIDVVNEALGYRARRVVNVLPGQTAPVRLDWPKGSLALNAQPWADVWIDGERVGETPIGNVAVPIGTHEVVFRHPVLGEQVVRTTVTANEPTRLSVDLRKK